MITSSIEQPLLNAFSAEGYVIVPNFISGQVAKWLRGLADVDLAVARNSHVVLDAEGRESRLSLWYEPGDDAFGRLSCSDRTIRHMEAFLGGEVSFFHAKMMQKLPAAGGSWEWHQDYGYWYDDGFLKADMGSCYVALDAATEANGCLQVIPRSHRYGRLDHGKVGGQTGADLGRVAALRSRHGVVSCVLEPGDAIFFHANLLHSSGANTSTQSRLGLISCFFRTDNESLQSDPRYRNKPCELISHDDILA